MRRLDQDTQASALHGARPPRNAASQKDNPRRLLFVLHGFLGYGVQRVTFNLIRALLAKGHDCTLFVIAGGKAQIDEYPAGLPLIYGTQLAFTPYTAAHGPLRLLRVCAQFPWILLRLIRVARQCDVVISTMQLQTTYVCWIAACFARRPLIAWMHISITDRLAAKPYPLRLLHRAIVRFIYKRIRWQVFVSQGALDSLRRLLRGYQANTWRVIFNAYDTSVARRESDPLPQDDALFSQAVVIALGRLSYQKGFDLLLRAHALLHSEGVHSHLLIVGEGPLRAQLERLAQELGVSKSVFMPGFVARPMHLLRRATVYAMSSRFEGLPGALIEALDAGLPILSTDCVSGPREILAGGRYGMLVAPENVAALAAGLRKLLHEDALRRHYAALGQERLEAFAPSQIAHEWEAYLARVFAEEQITTAKNLIN